MRSEEPDFKSVDPVSIYGEFLTGLRGQMPHGFWRHTPSARSVLEAVWERTGVTTESAPRVCRARWYRTNHLSSLLAAYGGSPSRLLMTLFPGRYTPRNFPELPKAGALPQSAEHTRRNDASRQSGRKGTMTRELLRERLQELHRSGKDLSPRALNNHGGLYNRAVFLWPQGGYYAALLDAGIDPATVFDQVRSKQVFAAYKELRKPLPRGFWNIPYAPQQVLTHLWTEEHVDTAEVPGVCSKRWFTANGLDALIRRYGNSPTRCLTTLFPNLFSTEMFLVSKPDGGQSRRATAAADRVTCPMCRKWFRPAKVHTTTVRYCPYCGIGLPQA